MPGRIAIDFGTSNTVVSSWDIVRLQGINLPLPEISKVLPLSGWRVAVIPSLVHYGADQTLFGSQIHERNLLHSPRTFQWMKRYVSTRVRNNRQIDDRIIADAEAGEEFLSAILKSIQTHFDPDEEEIAMTLPVESFEHYENWLTKIAQKNGIKTVRFIDEPSAAALSYRTRLSSGEAFLVMDFGAGALSACVVADGGIDPEGNRRSHVVGKAGVEFGAAQIDEWIFADIAHTHGYDNDDPDLAGLSRQLLNECEGLKERLSFVDSSSFSVMNPLTGAAISMDYTRHQLERLLEKNNMFGVIEQVINRAMSDAGEKGFDDSTIAAVLMVGGGSLIPSVQAYMRRRFGKHRVKIDRPLDAVARGAAAFVAGESFLDDYLQHDYVIRYRNAATNELEYRTLIKRGSSYPSPGYLASFNVKASSDGQEEFMMQILERSDTAGGAVQAMELRFDEEGNARLKAVGRPELEQRNYCSINENQTVLRADPPAVKGEDRFEISFSLDNNRRLVVSARDLKK